MTDAEKTARIALVRKACHELGEHFGAVQILCSFMDGEETKTITDGAGNWFTRLGMARDLVQRDFAREVAIQINAGSEAS